LLRGVSVFLTPTIGWTDRHDQLLDSSDSCLIDPPDKVLRRHHLASRIKQRDPDHPPLA
jgi:hypothetical protein